MKITGNYTIDAPRDEVWAALNDIEVLARIVPGCERLEQVGENEFEGTVKIGIQAIKGSYNGRIRLEDIQPPHHYKLVASGRSASGVVDGAGTVDLAEQDGKTMLTYGGDAQIGGTLASVGQRLIEGASKQMINQSLKALVEQIKARQGGAAQSDNGGSSEASLPSSPSAPPPTTEVQPGTASSPNGPVAEQSVAAAAASAPAAVVSAAPESSYEPQPAGQPQLEVERRTVIVPDSEQLKPEAMVRGIVDDLIAERPWLPWVALAFLLGMLFGRMGRR